MTWGVEGDYNEGYMRHGDGSLGDEVLFKVNVDHTETEPLNSHPAQRRVSTLRPQYY